MIAIVGVRPPLGGHVMQRASVDDGLRPYVSAQRGSNKHQSSSSQWSQCAPIVGQIRISHHHDHDHDHHHHHHHPLGTHRVSQPGPRRRRRVRDLEDSEAVGVCAARPNTCYSLQLQ